MKNTSIIIVLLLAILGTGAIVTSIDRTIIKASSKIQTGLIDTYSGTPGSIDIDGNKYTNSSIASGNTDLVPFKQLQDTTAKYFQKKDTLSIDSIPKYDQQLVILQAIGSNIKARPLFSNFANAGLSYTLEDRVALYNLVYIEKECTITGAKFNQITQGSFTGDQFNGIALYKLVSTTLVKVASTANDQNIWKAASGTIKTAPFTSTYHAYPGIYYIAHLYNNSAQSTAPTISQSGSTTTILSSGLSGNDNKIIFYVASQDNLPTTQENTVGVAVAQILNTWLY